MAVQTFTAGQILTAADTNTYLANSGLVYITSATVGSGVASVSIAGCFSSTYDNYKVVYAGGVGSTAQAIGVLLTGSATGYYGATVVASFSAAVATSNGASNASSWLYAGASSVNNNYIDLDILGPNLAKATGAFGPYIVATTSGVGGMFSGYHDSLYQATGLTFGVAGTLTGGTVTVYGYRKA